MYRLEHQESLEFIRGLDNTSIDTCITVNAKRDIWQEVLRVLKPGGSLLHLGKLTHRTTCQIEDAGFAIRDAILIPSLCVVAVAMKPIEGTFVDNAMKHGIAGFNIDASRIAHQTIMGGNLAYNPHLRERIAGGNGGKIIATEKDRRFNVQHKDGRFPANLILCHHESCQEDGVTKIKNRSGSVSGKEPSHTGDANTNCYGVYDRQGFNKYGDKDGMEEVPKWICHPDCPVKRLNQQSISQGIHSAGKQRHKDVTSAYEASSYHAPTTRQMNRYGDEGGAGRFYQNIKTKQQLLRCLCLLTSTPFESTVLDPFASDGDVGLAALSVGRRFVGCEADRALYETALNRMNNYE